MKKKIFILSLVILASACIMSFRCSPKGESPAAKANYHNKDLIINISYCRPYKKGRLIFGDESAKALQPFGKYWRVGANEATTFEVNQDILFNKQELKAGKYQLYAIPGKDTWQIFLNSEWKRWGFSEANHKTDVLKTEVPADNNSSFEEQFIISFENPDANGNSNLVLHWDKTLVKVPFTAK